jgi:hypothetical protein
MIRTYLGAISLFLSGCLRKEGIAIESSRNIVEGLLMLTTKCMTGLQPLEDTYSKAKIKPNDTKDGSKFLKLNSAAHIQSPSYPKRCTNVFLENTRHDMPLQPS